MDAVVTSKLVVENFVTPKWLFLAKNGRKTHFFSKTATDIQFFAKTENTDTFTLEMANNILLKGNFTP